MELRNALPHLSETAFASFVGSATDHGLSEIASSRTQMSAMKHLHHDDTPFGPVLITLQLTGKPPLVQYNLVAVNPMAYLYTSVKAGGGFSGMIMSVHAQTPSSPDKPWRLVLYSDEVTPGNQLKSKNTRKMWAIYFRFLSYNYTCTMNWHGAH